MQIAIVENLFASLIDWAFISEAETVKTYVENLRANHPTLRQRELAQKIVDEQALNNGMLGAATGLMSAVTLPIMLPLDIIKTWKIQDFTIKSVAHLYGYTPHNPDLKTAVFLLLANGSLEELKEFAINEATQTMSHAAFNTVDALKMSSIKLAAKEAPGLLAKSSETLIATFGLTEAAKYLTEALCKVCGRKVTEKVLARSLTLSVPVIGATIGGGVDWITTQAVGNLAIEFFENSGIEFVKSLVELPPSA